MELYNAGNGKLIAGQVEAASTFLRRFRGLMLTRELPQQCALHIRPCRSVHTYFMRYPIDVLYLDEAGHVVGTDERLAPGKIGSRVPRTRSVVELPAGRIRETDTRIGQTVKFVESLS
jgi:uncharacterized protein